MNGERERVVLVMTDIIDPTADRVVAELDRRGAPVFRCNPGDFPQLLTLAAHIDQSATDGLLRLHDREGNRLREVLLGDVGCGYYRRPTAFRIPDDMPESWQWWAAREARQGFGGVIATLPRWINHPTAIARAEYKPVQLTEAAACGMRIPRTLVTNDPREAKEFAETVGPTVHKRLSSAIGPDDPLTRLVDPSEIEIGNTAHLFQEWVPKAYEVRLTVVDDAFFAVRIDPTSPHVDVDWRADYDALHHTVIETPPAIRTAVAALMKRATSPSPGTSRTSSPGPR